MTKTQIITELKTKSQKYKNVTASYLMKYKKQQLLDMLENMNKPDPINEQPEQKTKEPEIKITYEEERLLLIEELTRLLNIFSSKYPKEITDFDWKMYGDNPALKIDIKVWKYKLKQKNLEY